MGLSLSSLTERFLQVISSLATSSRPNEWSRAPNRRVPQQEGWFVSLEHWMLLFLHHQNNITRLSVATRLLCRQWWTCRSHHELSWHCSLRSQEEFGTCCGEDIVRLRVWMLVSRLPERDLQTSGEPCSTCTSRTSHSDFVLKLLPCPPQMSQSAASAVSLVPF